MGGANPDIEQELMFVGREEGKLLAIRQLSQRAQLHPPALVFVQSQERAQALFGELLYDGIHVDVIHAGRSKAARDAAVSKFRRGDTWVLICTDLVARGVDFRAVNMVINYDLPMSGITYVHRIGRTGRAGRKGKAITLFTEADFENLRTIANVMKQSGCEVPEWMLTLKRKRKKQKKAPRRRKIDTTPSYDKIKRTKKIQSIERSRKQKAEAETDE
jgi:ATP-dependent RNA helicase DDX52/ROK1